MKEIETEEKMMFNQIQVKSSPFIRSLTTGAVIYNVIKENRGLNTKLEIDYTYGESLKQKFFKENPLPALELNTHSPEELDKKYGLAGTEITNDQTQME